MADIGILADSLAERCISIKDPILFEQERNRLKEYADKMKNKGTSGEYNPRQYFVFYEMFVVANDAISMIDSHLASKKLAEEMAALME